MRTQTGRLARRLRSSMAFALTYAPSFYAYAQLRGLFVAIGFDFESIVWGLVFVTICLVTIGLACALSLMAISKIFSGFSRHICFFVFCGVMLGSVMSEIWMLHEEIAFRKEVLLSPAESHGRERVWPNVDYSLVYFPSYGIGATD